MRDVSSYIEFDLSEYFGDIAPYHEEVSFRLYARPAPAVTGIDHAFWRRIRATLGPTVIKQTIHDRLRALKFERSWDRPLTAEERADRDLMAHLRTCLRKRRSDFKSGAGLTPYPVYVAQFADGTEQRVSFYTRAGKPIDFAAGYNAAMLLGRAVPTGGHVESAGQRCADPHFTQEIVAMKPRKESPAARLAAICKALNEGEIEAALIMARAA